MGKIEFINCANNRNIVLFIHGFTGGEGTWNRKKLPSFPEMLRNEKEIRENFDLAIINYYTQFASLETIRTVYNGIKRVLGSASSITHKNLGIRELSISLKSVVDQYCSNYDNIFIVAHSMGGLITKSLLLDEIASGSERVKIFFSLAVPHKGAAAATLAKVLYKGNKQLSDLANNSIIIDDINQRWIELYAGMPKTVYFYGSADRMVSARSAISFQRDKPEVVASPDDHYTISKPENTDSLVYVTVKNKLIEFIEENKEVEGQQIRQENIIIEDLSNSTKLGNDKVIQKAMAPFVYRNIQGHIPRKVIEIDKYNPILSPSTSTDLKEPMEALKENKHIVLVGGAGTGKSIEMNHIAYVCSKKPYEYIPILINLNKFVPRSLNQVLSEYWSEWSDVPENELILILDGLDEIEGRYKKDAIKYIELFLEQHPDIRIIVSCRRNFYQSESNHFSGTLQGFKTYLLNPLAQNDIDSYTASILGPVKLQEFKRVILQSNIKSLVNIPFYLVRIIEMYMENGSLPNNKASLFEQLISQGIYKDIDHFKNAIDLRKEKTKLVQALEVMAFSMEDLGKNYLTDEEFSYITDEETRELLAHSAIWKRVEESNQIRWQFEHNNFQEFLAAKILSRLDIKLIMESLTFGPEYKKLIPAWLNTFSFLVSLLDSQDSRFSELLEWVIKDDPEMLFYFEADKIDEQIRVETFQRIFNNYEEKQIWINRDKFDYQELVKFGGVPANFEFLLDKISKGHYTTRVNALKLLQLMQIPVTRRSIIGNHLIGIIENQKEHSIVRSAALAVLSQQKFKSTEEVKRIVIAIRTSTDDWIRTYLYRYLINCNVVDDNIDVFLEGIKFVGLDRDSNESRLIDERVELEKALGMVKTPESVGKILTFFNENIDSIDHFFLKEQFKVTGINATVVYKENNSVFFPALALFITLYEKYWLKEARDFSVFFDKSQTSKKAIELILEQRKADENNIGAIGLLIDEDIIDFISQQYLENNLSNDDIWKIQRAIYSKEHYTLFNNCINKVSNNMFEIQPRRDYEQERRDRLKSDIGLLFNKRAFLEQVMYLYKAEKKDSFNQDEVINTRVNKQEFGYSSLVIDHIYGMIGVKPVTYDEVVERVESWDWDFFCISNIYRILSSSPGIVLDEDQVKWVSNWCIKNVNTLKYKDACKKSGINSFSTSNKAVFFWYFLRKYNLKYPENVLLDMISFDWIEENQMLGIEYLEEYLSIEIMAERVWHNLQNGIEIDDVLNNHIDFCKRHSINDVVSYAFQIIIDASRSATTRSTALKAFVELSKDMNVLIGNLSHVKDDFKWEIVRTLFDKGFGVECQEYLISILLNEALFEEERLQSAKFLIKLQNLEALNFYVRWIDKKVENNALIEKVMPLHELKAIESLPYLIELLSLSYNEGFREDGYDRVDIEIRSALTNIALQSNKNFIEVKNKIINFIQENPDLKFINFLNIFIEDLEARFYVTLQKKNRNIHEVKERVRSLGLRV
ncbi:hypothetical protein [Bacillus mobilis]|uniref:hypothetical protein n=1 Tax=Bacillus mobilis TaxID=2026190 RepID=UPI003CF88026